MVRPRKTTLSARGILCWHTYHKILIARPSISMARRRYTIRECKPPHERSLRLRLFRTIRGQLPRELVELGRRFRQDTASSNDWAKWTRLLKKHAKAINALHAIECPNCPWNGRTIFPRKRRKA